jgi:DNA-binding MarR family transcriptional regulator
MRKTGDRRITYLTLTASGLKLLEETPNILHDRLAKKLDSLSDADVDMVKKSLEIIISAMQISKLDAAPVLTTEEPID